MGYLCVKGFEPAIKKVCHNEILDIMYQCVQHLSNNILQAKLKQFLYHEGNCRDEYAVSLLKAGTEG